MIGYYNRRVLSKIINVKNIYCIGHKANVLTLYNQYKMNAKHQASQRNPHISKFYTINGVYGLVIMLMYFLIRKTLSIYIRQMPNVFSK